MPPTTCSFLPSASAPASNSGLDRHSVHAVALKLPEFWADNAHVWFVQTEVQFAIKAITYSSTKFYYWVAALGKADTSQVVDTKFVHLEAQFYLRKINSSSTKFYRAISAPPSKVCNQLTHLIQDPGEDPYQTTKDQLYSLNDYQRVKT